MKEKKILEIMFGALCPPIHKQIKDQGYCIPMNDQIEIKLCQKLHDAVCILKIHGIISDSVARDIEKKIFNRIVVCVENAK
jgi:hypothetical protein